MILLDPTQSASVELFAVADVQLLFHAEAVRLDGFGTDVPRSPICSTTKTADQTE